MAEVKAPSVKTNRSGGTGTSVSVYLQANLPLLEKIRLAAKADDRGVSNYLKRRLVELDRQGVLIAAPATAKGPNVLFRKSLETQLAKLHKKAAFHATKANEYTTAAESIQSAINTLAQQTPGLFQS